MTLIIHIAAYSLGAVVAFALVCRAIDYFKMDF